MLTLGDLKRQGLTLTVAEAQELHPLINEIAQRGADNNVVFEGKVTVESNPLQTYYAELSRKNKELTAENVALLAEIAGLKANKTLERPPSFIEGGIHRRSEDIVKGKPGRPAKVS